MQSFAQTAERKSIVSQASFPQSAHSAKRPLTEWRMRKSPLLAPPQLQKHQELQKHREPQSRQQLQNNFLVSYRRIYVDAYKPDGERKNGEERLCRKE